jgi:predicted TPR repeat methyltransferase
VQTLFDGFADSFDDKLQRLQYRAPQWIAERLGATLPAPTRQFDIADLGCGTGLCASLIRPWARRLIGCDLSEAMLAKARQRGGYDELLQAELGAFLRQRGRCFDLLISADALCYFGALEEVAAAAYAALRDGGRFYFTVEALNADASDDSMLLPHGRYAHARRYVEAAMHDSGFGRIDFSERVLRMENGLPVNGWVVECSE